MKLKASKEAWIEALGLTAPITDPKATHFVAAHVVIDAKDKTATLSATNLITWSLVPLGGANVKAAGKFGIPARDLLDRVATMPAKSQVSVEIKDAKAIIKADGSERRHTLPCMPGAEFPALPGLAKTTPDITFPGEVFASMVDRVLFACSTDASRPAMQGVLVRIERERMRLAATDSKVIVKVDAKESFDVDKYETVITSKSAAFLARALAAESHVRFVLGPSHLIVRTGAREFGTATIDPVGFPDLDGLAPHIKETATVALNREALLDAINSVSLAGNAKLDYLSIDTDGKRVLLECDGAEAKSTDMIVADGSGKATVCLSSGMAQKALVALGTTMVRIGAAGPSDPVVIRTIDDTFAESFAVLAPVQS